MRAIRTTVMDVVARNAGIIPTPMLVDLRAQDYERAAEIIRERGLTKGYGEEDNGSVCAGGALVRAAAERVGNVEFDVDGGKAAVDMELHGYDMVQRWNDEPERTQEEVIERLEFAAKKLRNEGRS